MKKNIVITSDSTGFGKFIEKYAIEGSGLKVVKMLGKNDDEIASQISNEVKKVYEMSDETEKELKENALKTIQVIDWNKMIEFYYTAYEKAIKKSEKINP